MKKILEIQLREDGISTVECNLENELESARLAASFIVTASESRLFLAALMSAADAIREHSVEAKRLSELSKQSAAAKMFGGKNNHRS
jgi:hypothetical protein